MRTSEKDGGVIWSIAANPSIRNRPTRSSLASVEEPWPPVPAAGALRRRVSRAAPLFARGELLHDGAVIADADSERFAGALGRTEQAGAARSARRRDHLDGLGAGAFVARVRRTDGAAAAARHAVHLADARSGEPCLRRR